MYYKALHHQLHGLKQMLQKKNIHLVIRAADIVSVDISCNDAYFNCNVIPPASFPQSLIGNTS